MIRGIERRKIFRNNKDREDFIERLEALCPAMQTSCYAWAFMSNHAHFLFRTGTAPLSRLMRRLLTGYVIGFNVRHRRRGQLFQNRFRSIICQEDAYLRELVRYIHLNPIRVGIVKTLDELKSYKYCGHSSLMGKIKREWQDNDYVLGYFGKRKFQARKEYESYVKKGLTQDGPMGSGRVNILTLRKNRYKNKHNLSLGDQFWYQNPPFKEITIKWLEQKGTIFQDTSGI